MYKGITWVQGYEPGYEGYEGTALGMSLGWRVQGTTVYEGMLLRVCRWFRCRGMAST